MTYADLDVVERIISNLDAETIPLEYIVLARITDINGRQYVVQGEDLEEALRGNGRHRIAEARVVLNVKRLRRAIIQNVDDFYDEVYRNLDI
jgi:hypothetical protein